MAGSGFRPEPTPRAYCGERVTGQAPCYAEMRTVSPVRIHSPVRSVPAPRICRARVGIQPGWIVPAQRSWSPVSGLFGPGYPAPALRAVSPVRQHNPVLCVFIFLLFCLSIFLNKRIMNTFHAALWSTLPTTNESRYRRSHHQRTKQHGQKEQGSWAREKREWRTSWTWEEVMAGDKTRWR